jgi:hypothetical protein
MSVLKARNEGLPISGTYIKIVINLNQENPLEEPINNRPMIFSTLFTHECKVSVNHFKVRRNDENKSIVQSGQVMEF